MNIIEGLQSITDEEILLKCKSADTEFIKKSIEILAQRHQTAIFNYINKIIRDKETAEDLTQETFVRVFNKSREFKKIAKFSTWLYRIATNLSLNEIRDRKIRPYLTLHTPVGNGIDEDELISLISSKQAPPETNIQQKELAHCIEDILQKLPEKYRLVLILCDIEQFSYHEVARILRTSAGTIGSRLSRARRYFIEKFKQYIPENEI
ncbi:MAG: sigma-70 family RNA polymerase sigma factor [Planctomycetota bacterium]